MSDKKEEMSGEQAKRAVVIACKSGKFGDPHGAAVLIIRSLSPKPEGEVE